MKNWMRYMNGISVGMLGEYLVRVKFDVFALTLLIIISILIIIDLARD